MHLAIAKTIQRKISIALILAISLASIVGVCFGMKMDSKLVISDCPMMSGAMSSFCPMAGFDHFTSWLRAFIGIPATDFLVLLVILFAVGIVADKWRISDDPPYTEKYKYYTREHPDRPLYNYFLLIFSNGILQPKIFA